MGRSRIGGVWSHIVSEALPLPAVTLYKESLRSAVEWLLRSIEHGRGGSCACFSLLTGWSRPYPETTGYLIPTLLNVSTVLPDIGAEDAALRISEWLLSIQNTEGHWFGGVHPSKQKLPSVFNTGQILKGMIAMYRHSGDSRFCDAAVRGARWLAQGVGKDGLWPANDYQASATPSYYTHVAWPMLETWKECGEEQIRVAAERFLRAVLRRRLSNGVISGWGFKDSQPAFTHTIAYTIRGLQESARLLDAWEEFGEPTKAALEVIMRKAELAGGRLSGAFDDGWNAAGDYVCLTGNAQLAICLLLLESHENDLRIVNAAAKLVDYVCKQQSRRIPLLGIKGGIAGSTPVWGRYMAMRYPNWSAKYHCDALLALTQRIAQSLATL